MCGYFITYPIYSKILNKLHINSNIALILFVAISTIILVTFLFRKTVEEKLLSIVARRDLMHLYLGSPDYYHEKARYLYVRRLQGHITPQFNTYWQKINYYIGWYPIGNLFHFTDNYNLKQNNIVNNKVFFIYFKKTLVLDLDETIIASAMKNKAINDNYDEVIDIRLGVYCNYFIGQYN